jgi:pimeloyl-ACP methyl ester carboxylesterase
MGVARTPDQRRRGDSTRGRHGYGPRLYRDFLADFTAAVTPKRVAVVAAGHAASYALALARDWPGVWSRAVLLAPTWRGPLPTAMGEHPRAYAWARRLIGTPVIGEALYRLNTLRSVIGLMYRRHVYSEASRVTPVFIAKKQGVARRPGARFASVAFVTGQLDPVSDRDAFLALFDPPPVPILVLCGDATPPRSKAEWWSSPGDPASICAGCLVRLGCTRNVHRRSLTRLFTSSARPRQTPWGDSGVPRERPPSLGGPWSSQWSLYGIA